MRPSILPSPHSFHHASRPHAAFTLIELLVVISIIAILASMLLPAVGMIRDLANQQKCGSNLRQVAVAILAYGTDNEGLTPAYFTKVPVTGGGFDPWQYALAEQMDARDPADAIHNGINRRGPMICPDAVFTQGTPSWGDNYWGTCYGFNFWALTDITIQGDGAANDTDPQWGALYGHPMSTYFTGDGPGDADPAPGWGMRTGIPLEQVSGKSSRCLLGEVYSNRAGGNWPFNCTAYAHAAGGRGGWDGGDAGTGEGWDSNSTIVFRHRGKTNVAFFDGHMSSLKAKTQVFDALYDPARLQ